ncbi:sensor histidine kinase [Winogradskyella schleiferi]|uniref:sensor histidine kinase n=1 Tax=Winogradskyella schleiferi TaxID=2686078 RepID=UPI0015BC30B5|nr:sensor histidine kinase [Winogradskyella schleiferi]
MNYLIENGLLKNRILRHVLYWVAFNLFFGFIWGTYDSNFSKSIIIQLSLLPSRILLVYITLYYLIPKFILKKQIVLFLFFYSALLVFITIFIQKPILWYFVRPYYLVDWQEEDYLSIISVVNTLFEINRAAIIPMVIAFYRIYYTNQKKLLMLEKDQLKSELTHLKNQIHPHFLFNTLNNLYSLILKRSDKAEDAILKLSDLMRYMLYETNPNRVSLYKEINYLKNYINLEKLRLEEGSNINFITEIDKDYRIAPFILIPFIENVFKHGAINHKINGPSITVIAKHNTLTLHTVNYKRTKNYYDKGVGLENVKKRLGLLYTDKYTLEKKETEFQFELTLKLHLI